MPGSNGWTYARAHTHVHTDRYIHNITYKVARGINLLGLCAKDKLHTYVMKPNTQLNKISITTTTLTCHLL